MNLIIVKQTINQLNLEIEIVKVEVPLGKSDWDAQYYNFQLGHLKKI